MATTTNYGWDTPDDTDLVKDGAAAIRTLGSSIDTTTKNLNPETTTGDIAYRSATANTNTRLAIGSTGQVLTVAAGVPSWATPTDQTPLTTKGDVFTFSTVDARLGVGANGTVLTADSAETTGLKWAAPAAASFVGFSGTLATTTSTSNGVETVLNFNETIDTNAFHSDVTNPSRVTIPAGYGGKYLLVAIMRYADNATGYRSIYFRKNGSAAPVVFIPTGSGFATVVTASSLQTAVATDYFEIAARQGSGGNLNVENDTIFSAIYLGA